MVGQTHGPDGLDSDACCNQLVQMIKRIVTAAFLVVLGGVGLIGNDTIMRNACEVEDK